MKTRIFGCLLVLFASAYVWADGSTRVPLAHPIYGLLDRFAARGQIQMPNMRPLSRMEVASRLKQATGAISQTERDLLDRYRAEFARELLAIAPAAPQPAGGVSENLQWAWRDSVAELVIEPFFRQQLIAHRGAGVLNETVSQTYIGGILRGQYHQVGFRIRHFEAREWSSEIRQRPSDILASGVESVQLKGQSVDFREGVFELAWGNGWLHLDIGKGDVDWGPGRTGNLLLGNHAPTYGLFRLQTAYKNVRYTHMAGSLHAREGLYDTTRRVIDNDHVRIFLRKKRMVAHRLEVDFSKVTLGLHESVIYGDRDFEPLYVMPVTFFVSVQNHLENRDNLAMGIDASWRPGHGVELFGAWFFDDLAKLSPSAFSNKFGFQTGLFWVDPLGLKDVDVRAEYVRIEPFVYSHNFDINTYEHYGALLGHPIGPNSDLWHLKVTHRLSAKVMLSGVVEHERQGENLVKADGSIVNVGGNAQLGRRPEDPTVRRFMAGDVEVRTRMGLRVRYEPIRDWALHASYRRSKNKNVLLPTGARAEGVGHAWTATLDANFY